MGSPPPRWTSNITVPNEAASSRTRERGPNGNLEEEFVRQQTSTPEKSGTTHFQVRSDVNQDNAPQSRTTGNPKLTKILDKLNLNEDVLRSSFLKFRLLMWKNFLQTWRRPLQSICEILLPVLTMALILLIRKLIPPFPLPLMYFPSVPAYSLQFSMKVLSEMENPLTIAYSPKSPILESVLVSAMKTLVTQNTNNFPASFVDAYSNKVPIVAYNNSKHLLGIYDKESKTRQILAGVQFPNKYYGATELPKSLSYSIRFPEKPRLYSFFGLGSNSWETSDIFPEFQLPGPRAPTSWVGGDSPGYVSEGFLPLQHAISMALISKMTGQDIGSLYKIHIRRYPHPATWFDGSLLLLKMLFSIFMIMSCSYSASNIVRAIVTEKEMQLKETMKTMGLPTWLHWTALFFKHFIFQFLIAAIVTIILKVHWFKNEYGFADYAVFTATPWSVLFFFILLYLTCMIFFCFMLSCFFSKGSTASLITSLIWFLSFIPAFVLTSDVNMSVLTQVLLCLILNAAMALGFELLISHESIGGMQWGHFLSSPATQTSKLVFGHVVLLMLYSCFLYMSVTLYLEKVFPGPYGTPRPWYYPLQPQYWNPFHAPDENKRSAFEVRINQFFERIKNAVPLKLSSLCAPIVRVYRTVTATKKYDDLEIVDYKVVQDKDPEDHTVGVKMEHLTKAYGDQIVVNNLNLKIYNNQVTVLLGHNGAGKTTTISMLTGNVEVTKGTITVAGHDISTEAEKARSHIGLCPQHNVLFDELTVREHLEFFSRLKGLTGSELKTDINALISKLELEPKRNCQSKGLSGGQKRRLCVGIALSGHAKVVLLDEPTSGMDPASRRGLWDLLQKEKQGRSMILTTHFMDEADVLGDRVAIMAHGKLQCVGSPFFLKGLYGVGYTLVVEKDEGFDVRACTALINKHIPDAALKEDRGSEVAYSLTNDYCHKFEEMLSDFENNAANIKFKSYGLVPTTLEDVFMNVGADLAPVTATKNDDASQPENVTDTKTLDDSIKPAKTEDANMTEIDKALKYFDKPEYSVKGSDLIKQRIRSVWLKLFLVWTRSWWIPLVQVLASLLLLNSSLGTLVTIMSLVTDTAKMKLSLDTGHRATETLLGYNGSSDAAMKAVQGYKSVFQKPRVSGMRLTDIGNSPMMEYYLERAKDPTVMATTLRSQVLIGSFIEDDATTAYFSNFALHDIAISLATLHSALLRAYNPDAKLTVYNYPMKVTYNKDADLALMLSLISGQLNKGLGTSLGIVSSIFIMFYIRERVSGAKLLQKSAGLQPIIMWGSAAFFDWTWFILVCIPILFLFIIYDVPGFSSGAELGQLFLLLMFYVSASVPLIYILSFIFASPGRGFTWFFFINIIGMVCSETVDLLNSPELAVESQADKMDAIFQFFPLYSLLTAVRSLNTPAVMKRLCLKKCAYLQVLEPKFECKMEFLCKLNEKCCIRDYSLFDMEKPGVGRYILAMLATCLASWIILMIVEYGFLKQILACLGKRKPKPLDPKTLDEDVVAEAEQARKVYNSDRSKQALLTIDLTKYYSNILAVNQISFRVNDGEIFGLLGVNGAGKTTTFKMLIGDETISYGQAFVSGHSVAKTIYKVHENIGYCPQFDALIMELTGRETLKLFALMRGMRKSVIPSAADAFACALGFYKHMDKRVEKYSGGNRRKLNAALAFLGRSRLIFVDEPTTGVDPAARRHVWRALRGVQHSGRAVVLTSHSMEECEALCSRLTIMVNGRFQCMGTPQHLKIKFSEGYTLTIKLKTGENEKEIKDSSMRVKEYVNSKFNNPKLMEEYQGLMTFYLPDRSIPWSKMFGIMERAKIELPIEDYSIAQTTLEQIFLHFTKYQGVATPGASTGNDAQGQSSGKNVKGQQRNPV